MKKDYRPHMPDQGGLWSIAANGSSQPTSVFPSRELVWPWTADSDDTILFTMNSGPRGVYGLNISQEEAEDANQVEQQAGSLDIMPVSPNEFAGLKISPNGNWLSYVSSETGVDEVYVRPYPEIETGKWQASIGGGVSPLWNGDGTELFYHWAGQQFSVKYSEQDFDPNGKPTYIEFDRPIVTTRVPLLHGRLLNSPWAFSTQRNEFLAITGGSTVASQEGDLEDLLAEQVSLVVIEDWFAELRSSAPRAAD